MLSQGECKLKHTLNFRQHKRMELLYLISLILVPGTLKFPKLNAFDY
jgi:hypothetical protein